MVSIIESNSLNSKKHRHGQQKKFFCNKQINLATETPYLRDKYNCIDKSQNLLITCLTFLQ